MHLDDQVYQRFVWRDDENNPMRDCALTTVTFGIASAAHTAIRTLIQLADDVQGKFPLASAVLKKNCYVDDVHFGAETAKEAVDCRNEVVAALGEAGFELRKWTANNKELLNGLPEEHLGKQDFVSFLGMVWDVTNDILSYPVLELPSPEAMTRRQLLAEDSTNYHSSKDSDAKHLENHCEKHGV